MTNVGRRKVWQIFHVWVNVQSPDYYLPSSLTITTAYTALHDPLYDIDIDIDAGIKSWISNGVSANKLVLGLPCYGYACTLLDPEDHGLGALTEIQNKSGWIGFDDVDTVATKVFYVKMKELLGYFVWHVGYDDVWVLSKKAQETILSSDQQYAAILIPQELNKAPPPQDQSKALPVQEKDKTPPPQEQSKAPPVQEKDKAPPPPQEQDKGPPPQEQDKGQPHQRRNNKLQFWAILVNAAAYIANETTFLRKLNLRFLHFDAVANGIHFGVDEDNSPELQVFRLDFIISATGGFSDANKLGEGGFGSVYKGKSNDGQEIAVKRLSRSSVQGLQEFKTEITLIAKLQHLNLVRILGYCIEGEENILVYEYMPNKSLDCFIFGMEAIECGKTSEFADPILDDQFFLKKMVKYIQVGLLCVQHKPKDRPNMLDVVSMLNNETASLLTPKQPAFSSERNVKVKGMPNMGLSIWGFKSDSRMNVLNILTTIISSMTSQASSRKSFINSSIKVARLYNFRGLEFFWISQGTTFNTTNANIFFDEWRIAVTSESKNTGKSPLILSCLVHYMANLNSGNFPVVSLDKNMDWINMRAISYYYPNLFMTAYAALYDIVSWINSGGSANKLVLLLPYYGYACTLVDPEDHGLTWVGFNDVEAIAAKISYIKQMDHFGYSVWNVGCDENWALSQLDANKLGQGGFGPVYKGKLSNGQEFAVKRLSTSLGQGFQEFKTEITLIAKLRLHLNLVRILGYCIEGEENILAYEYVPNKSLDCYIFDSTKRVLLDWQRRVVIIDGIAQGLLYLHQYSRLRVVHRDLKASNILLNDEMNTKISDFGMARIFGRNEYEAITNK
ncbi:hypothetical protein GIB67_031279 [Kingdonia uniflora]|uniref:non-specific serine/threonine protein kinase n=1 Tax=Kingdonia uniflora TaxID=39325 RepID=A0A7J7P5N4_9MAGN|nr:hypothetical protein GIB67_031279 [Kingdonia uniflora]